MAARPAPPAPGGRPRAESAPWYRAGVIGLVLVAFIVVVLIASARANELFYLSVRDAEVLVVRGRIPARLLSDIRDVVERGGVKRGSICAAKESGGARLSVSGDVDANTAQRLRNVFGIYPMAGLRSAPPISHPTLGQILGIAWLAWLLRR